MEAPLSPLKAESKAFEAGILFALGRGFTDVVLEGDLQVMVNALAGYSSPPSVVASIIQGIHEIGMEFRQVQFSHVKRQGNMPAHLVAKNAYSIVFFFEKLLIALLMTLYGLKSILALPSKPSSML